MESIGETPIISRYLIHFKNCNKAPVYADDYLIGSFLDDSIINIECTDGTIITCKFDDCIIHDLSPDTETIEIIEIARKEIKQIINIDYIESSMYQ